MKLEDFKKASDIQQKIYELNECLDELTGTSSSAYIKHALYTYTNVTCDDGLLHRVRDEVYNVIQSKIDELEKEFMDL